MTEANTETTANETTAYEVAGYPAARFHMGFKIDGVDIPDPAVFTGAESDLDTEGERDVEGTLHRNKVATKYPLKIEYHNIPFEWIMEICGNFRETPVSDETPMAEREKKDSFSFTFPSPFMGAAQTITAYCGDLEFETKWSPPDRMYLGNLKFSVIQY